MRSGHRDIPNERPSWFEPPGGIPLPRRPQLPDRPQQRRVSEWAAAGCEPITGGVARGALWRFTVAVADVLYPGIGIAVAAAQRVTKWGPRVQGLNDERGADVKVGLIGAETLGLWVLFRTRLGQSDPGPRPPWCLDLPLAGPVPPGPPGPLGPAGPFGTEGIRRDASVISGVEDAKPAEVAPLLLVPPLPGAATRVLVRADVRRRSGVLAVDAGDGAWQRRMFFTVVHPAGRAGNHPERYRVACPVCARRRLAQFRGFEVCSDCGWLDARS
ncbi:hypothetical protein [Couchioplanes azureus]|uniref:hypothetical protein n=1 Tax=Couchioplanes caeruleus TaxID=56438 RepID=UPI00166F95FF|nr:hypothetical protein [Couchioplanes caeruleus]GGQ56425.1 hypothetical protein GCM10010166_27390 [Couchioplanes caeruleus subsp. azureus]